jgi:hypothetical protein
MYLCFDTFLGTKLLSFVFFCVPGRLFGENGSWVFLGSKLRVESQGWGICPTSTYMEAMYLGLSSFTISNGSKLPTSLLWG